MSVIDSDPTDMGDQDQGVQVHRWGGEEEERRGDQGGIIGERGQDITLPTHLVLQVPLQVLPNHQVVVVSPRV